ncbi:TPA: tgtA5 cluster protein 2 [Salmonella enterica subsp. salamae serovar 35:g,m,s,t:-]|nr:tgtA5 cluster protein 2 [Salmonella enterica subsp. salamae serovar 35:g,m,s,t:-]HCA3549718.1 tgtA5 cluster protein 2 [Salmonella enterica subsp. salamae serovar 35:g,m,s,t:-]
MELWAISAGLGLRHESDPAIPYESTFHNMKFSSKEAWNALISNPPLPGLCSSIATLMATKSSDIFVIAGSPIYITAVEHDILQYTKDFSKDNIIIVTSKGYEGPLQKYVVQSHAGLLSELNANMTTLNISYAREIIHRILNKG